ncbi:MAG: ubiquinol-cytochrome C chaperone family protein [Devosia sp.]
MIFNLFRKSAPDAAVYSAYNFIVAQSRQPRFYADWGVPDTVTGRFDMISLHLALLLRRLKADESAKGFGQQLVNLFFSDMDRSLREMGVGDLSVPKKIGNMGKLFYGTLNALDESLTSTDAAALEPMLVRNIYGGTANPGAAALAGHLRAEAAALELRPVKSLLAGDLGVAA